MPRVGVGTFAIVVAVLTATGCMSGSGAESSGASPTPTQTDASATAEDLALEAYEDMWDVVVEASHAGEAEPGELDRYASDQALALMHQALEGAAEDQASVTGEPELEPQIVGASPSPEPETVEIEDCMDDSRWLEDAENTPTVERRQVDATVTYDGLAWRVSELRIREHGSC